MAVTDGIVHFFNQVKAGGCLTLRPALWNALQHIQSVSKADTTLFTNVDHLEVRVSDEPTSVGLRLTINSKHSKPHSWESLRIALGDTWRIATHDEDTQPTLRYDLGNGVTSDVPLNSFVQINSAVNRLLLHHVVETAQQHNLQTFLDLYAGAGNVSLPLLALGMSGTAIERSNSAINALAQHQLTQKLEVFSGDVHNSLQQLQPVDLVVCNPPRSGIKQGYGSIASLASKIVLLVSCNPETLAADSTHLLPYGFSLEQLTPFDMFPGTNHVETVAVLTR